MALSTTPHTLPILSLLHARCCSGVISGTSLDGMANAMQRRLPAYWI